MQLSLRPINTSDDVFVPRATTALSIIFVNPESVIYNVEKMQNPKLSTQISRWSLSYQSFSLTIQTNYLKMKLHNVLEAFHQYILR